MGKYSPDGICDCPSCKKLSMRLVKLGNNMEWISVKERLPEENQNVLTIFASNPNVAYRLVALGWFKDRIYIAKLNGNSWTNEFLGEMMQYEPTHWMPLPSVDSICKDM